MKFHQSLLFLAPLVQAGPVRIRDSSLLAELGAKHDHVLEALHNHTSGSGQDHGLVKRNPVFPGFFVIVQIVGDVGGFVGNVENKILDAFKDDSQLWESKKHCRIDYSTHGGGNCMTNVIERDAANKDPTVKQETSCAWNEEDDPILSYYEDDVIGKYSVQYTATSGAAWDGIDDTKKCEVEGLCNPQYIFYRGDYNLVLNTWQTEGVIADCQYKDDCGGLCSQGVLDQFRKNGALWGGSCAVPCKDEDYLPDPDSPA